MSINNIYIGDNQVNSIGLNVGGADKSIQETSFEIFKSLEEYTWSEIKAICQAGNASTKLILGDTKKVYDNAGYEYNVRLVDLQVGRYNFTGTNNPNHAVFEVTNTYCQVGAKDIDTSEEILDIVANNEDGKELVGLTGLIDSVDLYYVNIPGYASETEPTMDDVDRISRQLFLPAASELATEAEFRTMTVYPYIPALLESTSTYDQSTQLGMFDYYKQVASLSEARKKHWRLTAAYKDNYYPYWTRTLHRYTGVSQQYTYHFAISDAGALWQCRSDRIETVRIPMYFAW